MADWQEAVQVTVITVIFAFMVAKLVAVVISFRGENLRLERRRDDDVEELQGLVYRDDEDFVVGEGEVLNFEPAKGEQEDEVVREGGEASAELSSETSSEASSDEEEEEIVEEKTRPDEDVGLRPLVEPVREVSEVLHGETSVSGLTEEAMQEEIDSEVLVSQSDVIKSEGNSIEVSDMDEWEGVESSELEETFGASASFVATQTVGPGLKVANETLLLLYGLYKIATEGPCTTPQPSSFKLSARAKWNAWQKLGSMAPEEAMQKYIGVVTDISPNWSRGKENVDKEGAHESRGEGAKHGGVGGPIFSSLAMIEDDTGDEGTLDAIHWCAREGNEAGLLQQLENGTSIDLKGHDIVATVRNVVTPILIVREI